MPAATSIIMGAGAAVSAISAGASFAQAGKQNKLMREAKADAEKAMADARKSLEVNYYDVLGINKEPYERQREAMVSQGAQAIQAAQEGDRGAAAAAGRVQMAQNEAQAGIREQMGKELQDIQKLQAGEESRLRDVGTQLDLQEAEGAQQAMADAQKAKTAAIEQGIQGLSKMGGQLMQMAPLYGKGGTETTTPNVGGQTTAYNNWVNSQGANKSAGVISPEQQAAMDEWLRAHPDESLNYNYFKV